MQRHHSSIPLDPPVDDDEGCLHLDTWPSHRPRVLLAEDDDDLRSSLAALFERDGFVVSTVRNGFELLEVLADSMVAKPGSAPDVIVTDVRMPGFNTLNVVVGLRNAGMLTPIIMISAFGDPALRARIARVPRTRFFDKPVDVDQLEEAILDCMPIV